MHMSKKLLSFTVTWFLWGSTHAGADQRHESAACEKDTTACAQDDSLHLLQSADAIHVEWALYGDHGRSSPWEGLRTAPQEQPAAAPDAAQAHVPKPSRFQLVFASLHTCAQLFKDTIGSKRPPLGINAFAVLAIVMICISIALICAVLDGEATGRDWRDDDGFLTSAPWGRHRQAPVDFSPPAKVALPPEESSSTHLPSSAGPSVRDDFTQSQFGSGGRAPPMLGSPQQPTYAVSLHPWVGLTSSERSIRTHMAVSERIPSPVCPSLIVPACESRYAIALSEIVNASATEGEGLLNISGGQDHTLIFEAFVRAKGADRCLEIRTPGKTSFGEVLASIGNSRIQNSCILDIVGQSGSYYGLLEIQGTGQCVITRHGKPVMTLDGDSDELNLWLSSTGGQELASAKCSGDRVQTNDVDILVQPGMDAVLALACILAVLLFSPN
mmetsp:Transcript_143192/g.249734  ORF Transcript_143192/g.249734 Transcript_143192/m.249734 type:complete len:442 (-) Transcript_143192:186-1511(-)